MSQTYSTGDLANLAKVSVRTAQYYDKRGILVPSQLTEGGRRIYTESDLERLKLICFLRELDFSIEQIKRVLAEDNAMAVLELVLVDHIQQLEEDLRTKKHQLDTAVNLLSGIRQSSSHSLENLSDMSLTMKNQKAWRRLQLKMFSGIMLAIVVHLMSVLLTSYFNLSWLIWIEAPLWIIFFTLLIIYFRKQFEYLCPNCHSIFEPSFKEFAWAGHTPRTRKLTCLHCHQKSYCLELAKEK
ncbi:MerR family transcriptional regulator [Streptococcus ictaluri]|uniref:Transcriptional regulator, MerR family n=1 Tax=Streptococcus ictaluri 707-05 TaxID=764299 RepID=G5K511_9STRE|nr:MerR family transcriptional regulator [Streptococcus ictaluri]EHI68802.1 transcriptional regulator, MerR family [Streptococcus ictaluri 707-05]